MLNYKLDEKMPRRKAVTKGTKYEGVASCVQYIG